MTDPHQDALDAMADDVARIAGAAPHAPVSDQQGMTAEDVRTLERWSVLCQPKDRPTLTRAVDTYHAHAALQQEVERLKAELAREVARYAGYADTEREKRLAAEQDSTRLDALEAWLRACSYRDVSAGDAVYLSDTDGYGNYTVHQAGTLRAAIDHAMQEGK